MSSLAPVLGTKCISPVRFRGCIAVLEFVIRPPYAGEPVTLEAKGDRPTSDVSITTDEARRTPRKPVSAHVSTLQKQGCHPFLSRAKLEIRKRKVFHAFETKN